MTSWLKSRKMAAALVMLAWLVTLLSAWALRDTGREIAAHHECRTLVPDGLMLRLEALPTTAFETELQRPCVREAAKSMLRRDWLLILSYGPLVALVVVMLVNLRAKKGPSRWWVRLGVILGALAMLADAVENWFLWRALTPFVPTADLNGILSWARFATRIKFGALAAAALLSAILWMTVRSAGPGCVESWRRRWRDSGRWIAVALGVATTVVLGVGLCKLDPQILTYAGGLLIAFWSTAFLRAVGVAAEEQPAPECVLAEEAVAAQQDRKLKDERDLTMPPEAPPGSRHARAYPRPLLKREWQLTRDRRASVNLPPDGGRVGFGLSGGGIRSATVSLGVFQGLAAIQNMLPRIDFISSVSGGGYFGSFLGRLWNRDYVETGDVARVLRSSEPERPVSTQESRKKTELRKATRSVIRYLRENGRYLSPNGAGDVLYSGAVVLRNWVAIQIVLMTLFLTIFVGMQAGRGGLDWVASFLPMGIACRFDLAGSTFWWSPWLLLPLASFLLAVLPLGWAYWMVEPLSRALAATAKTEPGHGHDLGWGASAIAPALGLLLTFVVAVVNVFGPWQAKAIGMWALVGLTAALAFSWWRGAKWRAAVRVAQARAENKGEDEPPPGETLQEKTDRENDEARQEKLHEHSELRQRLSLWLSRALAITGVLLAFALLDSLGQSLYVALLGPRPWSGWLAGLLAAVGMVATYGKRVVVLFSKGKGDERPSLPVNLIAGIAAALLVVILLGSLNAASHAVAWRFGSPPGSIGWRMAETSCAEETVEACSPAELAGRACPPGVPELRKERSTSLAWVVFFGGFILAIFFGQTWPFVNRSSHHDIYSSRLTRAYLGASNPERWQESVTRVLRDDDCDLKKYLPPPANKGAPIHLINVTVNETVSGRSQIEQKDRKGNNLALGPFGLSFGTDHHAIIPLGAEDPVNRAVDVYPKDEDDPKGPKFRVFEYPEVANKAGGKAGAQRAFTGETLPLGSWVGISGAAFSTGLGARTSFGLSFLAGFSNVRLGRWWDSGVAVRKREKPIPETPLAEFERVVSRLLPVQVSLLDEFLARFPGPARRHWYLSDGGHFENLGGYELIRRRLPLIVLIDAEEDVDYSFGALSNLVRKARTDFGAEITFLDEEGLAREIDPEAREVIGTVEELRRGRWETLPTPDATQEHPKAVRRKLVAADPTGFSRAHAALAWVTYEPEGGRAAERCRLLYIKATLTGDEPTDVLEYHRAHPAFPHQSTGDQYFDEAQWESHRKLGEHMAEKVFGLAQFGEGGKWWKEGREQ